MLLYRVSLLVLLTLFACSQKSLEGRATILSLRDGAYGEPCEWRCARIDRSDSRAFVSPVIGKSQVGQVLRTRVFRFIPSIDGLATWEDVRTLVFKPNANVDIAHGL